MDISKRFNPLCWAVFTAISAVLRTVHPLKSRFLAFLRLIFPSRLITLPHALARDTKCASTSFDFLENGRRMNLQNIYKQQFGFVNSNLPRIPLLNITSMSQSLQLKSENLTRDNMHYFELDIESRVQIESPMTVLSNFHAMDFDNSHLVFDNSRLSHSHSSSSESSEDIIIFLSHTDKDFNNECSDPESGSSSDNSPTSDDNGWTSDCEQLVSKLSQNCVSPYASRHLDYPHESNQETESRFMKGINLLPMKSCFNLRSNAFDSSSESDFDLPKKRE